MDRNISSTVYDPKGIYVFRDFRPKPSMNDPHDPNDPEIIRGISWQGRQQKPLKAYRRISTAFAFHVKRHLIQDPGLSTRAVAAPFVIIADLYRIVAGGWEAEIENEHMKLAWLEWFYSLSKSKERTPERMEQDFMYLHRQRINVGSYHQLIEEALEQSKAHGLRVWMSLPEDPTATSIAADMQKDFECVQNRMRRVEARILQDINFVRAYMDEKAARESAKFSSSMRYITIAIAVAFPMSLLASIFGLPGAYSDMLRNHYWAYLVAAFPLILLFLLFFFAPRRQQEKKEEKERINARALD